MAVTIKSAREIELMKEAGKILAQTHEELKEFIRPGISTLDIDKKGEEIIRRYGCIPSFLNYNGYPASICVSVNESTALIVLITSVEIPAQTISAPASAYPACPSQRKPVNTFF